MTDGRRQPGFTIRQLIAEFDELAAIPDPYEYDFSDDEEQNLYHPPSISVDGTRAVSSTSTDK